MLLTRCGCSRYVNIDEGSEVIIVPLRTESGSKDREFRKAFRDHSEEIDIYQEVIEGVEYN